MTGKSCKELVQECVHLVERTHVRHALAKLLLHCQHLVYNLVGAQITRKAAFACCTERAAHWAANLG